MGEVLVTAAYILLLFISVNQNFTNLELEFKELIMLGSVDISIFGGRQLIDPASVTGVGELARLD